jgi:hypothetical protein
MTQDQHGENERQFRSISDMKRMGKQGGNEQNATSENVPVKSDAPIAKVLRITGTLSIAFGVIAGIVLLILLGDPSGSFDPQGGWSLGGIVIALGVAFFYCTLGVLSLGIAKVIELLTK